MLVNGQIARRPLAALGRFQERRLLGKSAAPAHPPVFVLGVPRSGTTLLYQILVECFEVAYFCNSADSHSYCPATMTQVLRPAIRRYRSNFTSDYGSTPSPVGPSEGRTIWRRWFTDGYADEQFLTEENADTIRRTVAATERVLSAPFLSKDPHHTVRVRALDRLFPRSLFVFIHRDRLATAESLLSIRRRRFLSSNAPLETWMSVKPNEYDRLSDGSYIDQICGQVVYCERNGLQDMRSVAGDRFVEVHYERLCSETAPQVRRIATFLADNGVQLRPRHDVPQTFTPSRGVDIPPGDREALRTGLGALSRKLGLGAGPARG